MNLDQLNLNRYNIENIPYYLMDLYESGLPLDVISNAVCKILAHSLNATNVSFLLYRGINDALVLSGNYINAEMTECIEGDPVKFSKAYHAIFNDIILFEYLQFLNQPGNESLNVTEAPTLEGYKKFHLKYALLPTDLTAESFNEKIAYAHKHWAKYNHYRNQLLKNFFYLGDTDDAEKELKPAAKYYKDCLTAIRDNKKVEPKILSYDTEDLNSMAQRPYTSRLLEKNVAERFEYDKMMYYPLVFKNRLFGILRIILNEKFKEPGIKSAAEIIGEKGDFENSITRSLSYHIGRQYLYKRLDKINIPEVISHRQPATKICKALSMLINCRGCILRIKDNNDSLTMKGNSSEGLKPYLNEVESIDLFNGHNALADIFSSGNSKHNVEVVALAISIDKAEKKVKEYTCYIKKEGDRLSTVDDIKLIKKDNIDIFNRLFGDRTQEIVDIYVKYDFMEILFFPIFIENELYGLLTFANTSHRFFVDEDVNILYPVVQKMMFGIISTRLHWLEFNTLFLKNIHHDLVQPAKALKDLNIVTTIKKHKRLPKKKKQSFIDVIEFLDGYYANFDFHISQMKFYNNPTPVNNFLNPVGEDFFEDTERIISRITAAVDYLEKIDQASGKTAREVCVSLHKNFNHDLISSFPNTIVMICIWHFMMNARKYSFSSILKPERNQLAEIKKILGEHYDYKKQLHIELYVESNAGEIRIDVTNYGIAIDKSVDIFNKQTRGSNFAGVNGMGNGLYIVRKLLSYAAGYKTKTECTHDDKNGKTVFTIKLKKQSNE